MKRATEERRKQMAASHRHSADQYRIEIERLRALGWRSDEQTGRLLEKHREARRAVVALGDRIARALTPADAAKFASAMKAAKRELDAIERKLGVKLDRQSGGTR